jgi:excisionase family DNA binding protein
MEAVTETRLDLKAAAAKLGISTRLLREKANGGEITFTRLDRLHWSFRLSDIETYLEAHTFKARTPYDRKPAKKTAKKAAK